MSDGVIHGEGYAIGSLDAVGEGPDFRKVRRELGVTALRDGRTPEDDESARPPGPPGAA